MFVPFFYVLAKPLCVTVVKAVSIVAVRVLILSIPNLCQTARKQDRRIPTLAVGIRSATILSAGPQKLGGREGGPFAGSHIVPLYILQQLYMYRQGAVAATLVVHS